MDMILAAGTMPHQWEFITESDLHDYTLLGSLAWYMKRIVGAVTICQMLADRAIDYSEGMLREQFTLAQEKHERDINEAQNLR